MKPFSAFLKKEWMELTRTGRLIVLLAVFVLFGIMNPAIAKLTPWMLGTMTDSLKSTGITVAEVTVDAMTSWTQFYKNIPMALIVFVLLWSGSFTAEYQKGTLIPAVTKGLARRQIVLAKGTMMLLTWSACYWLCYGITFAYNAYFWDNGIAEYPAFAAACYWLFGVWIIALLVLFSAVSQTGIQVLLGTGAVTLGASLLGMLPKLKAYVPTKLADGMSVLQGAVKPSENTAAALISAGMAVVCTALAVAAFNRKKL